MSGRVKCGPPEPSVPVWMRRWITAAMSEAKNTDSEPMKASVPAPMNEKRCAMSGVSSCSVQRPVIHTASVMRMSATPMMSTSGAPSRPIPRTRIPNATQNGVMVRSSVSRGRSVHCTFSTCPSTSTPCSSSQRGRSLRISGSRVKLPYGGGDVVAHSSVHARHGLSPATSPERRLLMML